MSLQDEIAKKSSEIYREAYQMSIGELINLYRDEELDIHPEFQRVFRWSDYQKTKLIESIMLNIPIPQIFVSQREDGTWDVIDGVQRLSTIFQFVGILKDEDGKDISPLVLEATDDLPSFAGMKWQGKSAIGEPLTMMLRNFILSKVAEPDSLKAFEKMVTPEMVEILKDDTAYANFKKIMGMDNNHN